MSHRLLATAALVLAAALPRRRLRRDRAAVGQGLRPPRRRRLPAAVPQRRLHAEGQAHRRPGCGWRSAPSRRRATPTGCRSTRPTLNRMDGFSPGLGHPHEGPRPGDARGAAAHEPGRARPASAPTPAGTRRCCSSTRAPASASRSGPSSTATPRTRATACSRSTRRATSPRAGATSSSCAACARAAARRIKAPARASPRCATAPVRTKRYDRIFRTLKKAEVRRGARALPDLGLHRGQPPLAVGADARASATTPSRSSATATSPTASSQGSRAALHAAARPRSTATTRSTARAGARCSRATIEVPCYLDQPGCAPGARFNLGAGRHPRPAAGQRTRGALLLRRAAHRDRRRARRACRSTATGCWAATARSSRTRTCPAMAEEHDIVFCATPWNGHVERGHPQRRQRAAGPRQDAVDRRPAAAGHARRALPRAADDPPAGPGRQPAAPAGRAADRPHRPPLLRRQQPGRDHGRRADGRRARLHPRGARRPRP